MRDFYDIPGNLIEKNWRFYKIGSEAVVGAIRSIPVARHRAGLRRWACHSELFIF